MANTDETPALGMCFEISADGRSLGSFVECTGLTVELGSEEYREGGVNHFTHKLPTHANTQSVTLKRGLTSSDDLWDWIASYVESTQVKPKTVQVALRTPKVDGPILRTWTVQHAYPLKWEGPRLDAMKGEIAFESIELAHRGVHLGS